MKKRYLLLLIMALFTACNGNEKIEAELGLPKYQIKDSDDPLDHLIYQVKEETGIQIIYDFDPEDATWNLGQLIATTNYRYVPFNEPTERALALEGVTRFVDDFLGVYTPEIKQQYFPLRVFVCDTISVNKKDVLTGIGRDHLAINLISSKDIAQDPSTYYPKLFGELHQQLWNHIFTYHLEVPPTFASYSSNYYNQNVIEEGSPNEDPRNFGFWAWDTTSYYGKWHHGVKAEQDVADYILRMATLHEEELKKQLEGYDILQAKYTILRTYIKEQTGLDLQKLGNESK